MLESLEDRTVPSGLTLSPQTLSATAGNATFFLPLAAMTDSDGNTNPMDYTAAVNYGDGGGTTSASVSWNMTCFGVNGFHTYANAGSYTVALTVTDSDGDQASLSETADVTSNGGGGMGQGPTVTSPGNQGDAVGDPVALQINASDPNGDPLIFSATNLPAGLSMDPGSGFITGTVAVARTPTAPTS